MFSKPINPNKENKRKPSPVKTKSNKEKTDNVDDTIRMTYSLDKKLYENDGKSISDKKIKSDKLYIRIFGEDFIKTNKDKCKMIIGGKEYEIKSKIEKTELKDYGINL